MEGSEPAERTVELWVRSFAPSTAGPTQERAIERVERLDRRGAVASARVGVWGKAVERGSRTERIPQLRAVASRLEAFEAWAEREGRALEPFFRARRVESTITGDAADVRRLPTVALAEYVDGEVVHLAPSREGERTIEVADRLDALDERTPAPERPADDRSGTERVRYSGSGRTPDVDGLRPVIDDERGRLEPASGPG